ncbi:MAG: hypothetical protein P8X50_10685 [Maritimibacter sp.]
MKHDRHLSFLNAVADGKAVANAMTQEELELRRKLLFRLLAKFDFDRPNRHYELVTSPLPHPDEQSQVNAFFRI